MMASNIPAEAKGLGTPTAEYTRNTGRLLLVLILSAYLSGAFICSALAMARENAWFLFLVIPGPLCMWWFVSSLRKRDLRVLVFPEGLSYTKQAKTEIFRWDDVASVWQDVTRYHGAYTSTKRVYTVHTNDDREYTFKDSISNVESLGNTIQQECACRILPRLQEAYNAGHTISFGKLSISKAGIAKGRKTLPWDQVSGVEIDRGSVNVHIKKDAYTISELILSAGKGPKWSSVAVAKMPNVVVFTAIVNQIVGSNE